MQHFGQCLDRAIRKEWKDHYIDYTKLKLTLKECIQRRKALHKFHRLLRYYDRRRNDVDGTVGIGHSVTCGACISDNGLEQYLSETDIQLLLFLVGSSSLSAEERNPARSPSLDHKSKQEEQQQQTMVQGHNSSTTTTSSSTNEYFRYEDLKKDDDINNRNTLNTDTKSPIDLLLEERDRALTSENLLKVERSELCHLLDGENKKATFFYGEQLDIVNQILSNLDRFTSPAGSETPLSKTTILPAGNVTTAASTLPTMVTRETENEIINEFEYVGNEILELYAFAVVNIISIRQILIRYDAYARTFDGMPLSQWYFLQERRRIEYFDLATLDCIHTMYKTKVANLLCLQSTDTTPFAILQNLHDDLNKNLNKITTCAIANATTTAANSTPTRLPKLERYLNGFLTQFHIFNNLLERTLESIEKCTGGNIVMRDRFIQDLKYYFSLGSHNEYLPMEPNFLLMRGRHLKTEMKTIAKWREKNEKKTFATTNDDENHDHNLQIEGKMDPQNVLPLLLNLLSCFLYMVNNYVIEPSGAYYANSLGSSDAYSGLIMALGPWFALVSAIGYSVWTNTEYKKPICFAATLQCIGNLLYANAYKHKSMTLCLVGRAIAGLGASKIINRRYVADATPFALRTASNAAFGLSMALGAAMGPALAILLDCFEFEFYLPFLGIQYFNGMTGPGYVMSFAWLVFLIIIILVFEEPNRSGLEELKQREAAAAAAAFASTATENPVTVDTTELSDSKNASLIPKSANAKLDDDSEETDDGFELLHPDSTHSGGSSSSTFVDEDMEDFSKHEVVAMQNRAMNSNPNDIDNKGKRNHLPNLFCNFCPCCQHFTTAVALCMALIFMKRIALESIAGSTSIITKNRYGWTIKNVGTLHFVNGILVIPVSIFSGYLSKFYQDRHLALWTLSITLVGMLLLIDVSDFLHPTFETDGNNVNVDDNSNDNFYDYDPSDDQTLSYSSSYNEGHPLAVGPRRYIIGSLISFSGVEACESFVASLMSKVVPSALATGTMNSGLLATLVGTAGRASGDLIITALGLISIRQLLNLLMIPGAMLIVISISLVRHHYDILHV